ncbi:MULTISPECIES: DUF6048 family protein [Zobellia]|uniref:DUF6048 family protein n=1 Tax=Zobellia TaxID=112040 RepID=UPI001C06F97B|nr:MULTISPECIES: DUF6048 family protein [unclassified Zobellia]MBU2976579.1 hypothetical protein [Zobellia sp. B3R18]MDO6820961.1 DUF6048 family protein [Zobellia sp. 1_MG-2023]
MLRYFTSLFFLLIIATGFSQSEPIDLNKKDTTVYKQRYGLRVGVDLSRLVVSFFEDNYTGLELVGDYRLTQNLYLAAELGNEKKTIGTPLGPDVDIESGDLYTFTTSGSYIKAGIDYNTYGNWYGEQNMIYIGGRFAFSTFSQELDAYKIFDTNRYWHPEDFAAATDALGKYEGRNKSWLEFVAGVKAEVLRNLYFGASARLGILITNKRPENELDDLFIPGFNKVTDGSRFGVGYNFSLSYLIPLYKKKNEPKKEEPQPQPEPKPNGKDRPKKQ